jgi:hypothetical protein
MASESMRRHYVDLARAKITESERLADVAADAEHGGADEIRFSVLAELNASHALVYATLASGEATAVCAIEIDRARQEVQS